MLLDTQYIYIYIRGNAGEVMYIKVVYIKVVYIKVVYIKFEIVGYIKVDIWQLLSLSTDRFFTVG